MKKPVVIIAMLVMAITCLYFLWGRGQRYPELAELNLWEHNCQPIIDYAKNTYIDTVHYPDKLPERYMKILFSFRVPAKYDVSSGANYEFFGLQIGDYNKFGWTYNYSCESGWYIDR